MEKLIISEGGFFPKKTTTLYICADFFEFDMYHFLILQSTIVSCLFYMMCFDKRADYKTAYFTLLLVSKYREEH